MLLTDCRERWEQYLALVGLDAGSPSMSCAVRGGESVQHVHGGESMFGNRSQDLDLGEDADRKLLFAGAVQQHDSTSSHFTWRHS